MNIYRSSNIRIEWKRAVNFPSAVFLSLSLSLSRSLYKKKDGKPESLFPLASSQAVCDQYSDLSK